MSKPAVADANTAERTSDGRVPRVLNVGSLNIDRVFRVPHLVRPGETLTSRSLQIFAGGKGANQAIALARAGAAVVHCGKVGPDGAWLLDKLSAEGIDTPRSRATSGRMPMMTNSVVPIPKDAAASARIGREIMEDPFAGDLVRRNIEIARLPKIARCGKGMLQCTDAGHSGGSVIRRTMTNVSKKPGCFARVTF